MNERRRVYIACLPFTYSEADAPPYVYGLLRAYAELDDRVRENYEFDGSLWRRAPVGEMVERLERPAILAVSLYVWNFRLSMDLCREAKKRFPECLIVAGGAHVPETPGDFLDRHPYVDVLVHGEGEIPFRGLLVRLLDRPDDLSTVRGLTFRRDGVSVSTGPSEKLPRDIDVPSPYLLGHLDPYVKAAKKAGSLGVLWETNRGCPYGCTFCDWGSNTLSKIRQFRMDRLAGEIAYFGEVGVDTILTCDANFGILPRDEEITDLMIATHAKTGHPGKFAVNYAKNSNTRVFDIASRLYRADMLVNGITLSMQSLDPTVLKAIRRDSIGVKNYQDLQRRYNAEKIPTYTELILGLPNETLDSWIEGIGGLIDRGHVDLRAYELSLLPNAKVSDRSEREKYRFQTATWMIVPPGEKGQPRETIEVVTSTSTLTFDEWLEGSIFGNLFARTLHAGAYTRFLTRYLLQEEGIAASKFYRALLAVAKQSPESTLGRTRSAYAESLRKYVAGETGWELDHAIETHPAFKTIVDHYPPLQTDCNVAVFLWLWLNENLDGLYTDVAKALASLGLAVDSGSRLDDLLRFVKDLMVTLDYDPKTGKRGRYDHDWHRYFFGDGALVRGQVEIAFTDTIMGGSEEFRLARGDAAVFFYGAGIAIDVHRRCHHQGESMRAVALEKGEIVERRPVGLVVNNVPEAGRPDEEAPERKRLPLASA